MAPSCLALPPIPPSELLTYVLTHQAYPTTLLICQPRASFLNSLLQSVPQYMPPQPLSEEAESDDNSPSQPSESPLERHPLLVRTLQQIATSRYINLVFVPSLSHLRAYLAVFPTKIGDPPPVQMFEKPGRDKPSLVTYGMVGLHRDTSEWSAQGLGSSFAALVEAGWRGKRKVVVFEQRSIDQEGVDIQGDETGEESERRKRMEALKVWEEKVPMLNRSVKRAGFDGEEGSWNGRTVEVGRILGRWFDFGRDDWNEDI